MKDRLLWQLKYRYIQMCSMIFPVNKLVHNVLDKVMSTALLSATNYCLTAPNTLEETVKNLFGARTKSALDDFHYILLLYFYLWQFVAICVCDLF